jgi:hypothetical protein
VITYFHHSLAVLGVRASTFSVWAEFMVRVRVRVRVAVRASTFSVWTEFTVPTGKRQ